MKYGPKPTETAVERNLAKLETSRERAEYKAKLFAEAHDGSLTFKLDGVTFTASGWEQDGPIFRVRVIAMDDNGLLPLAYEDNPFEFVHGNPFVHNGTYRKEKFNDQELDVPNMKLDPLEAAKEMIFAAVTEAAGRHGWQR